MALLQIKDADLPSGFPLHLGEDTFGTELISNMFLPMLWRTYVAPHLPIEKQK